MKEGKLQIYCGNGKGKTTAAIGQAIREASKGRSVFIVQFLNCPWKMAGNQAGCPDSGRGSGAPGTGNCHTGRTPFTAGSSGKYRSDIYRDPTVSGDAGMGV